MEHLRLQDRPNGQQGDVGAVVGSMLVLAGLAEQSLGFAGRLWQSGLVVLGSTPGATQVSFSGQWAVPRHRQGGVW